MTQQTDTRTKLLTVPPFKLMLSLSIPAIIGMVVVGLYRVPPAPYIRSKGGGRPS